MGATKDSFSSWRRGVKCGCVGVPYSMVVTIMVVMLYNVSCNVQNDDSSFKFRSKTYQCTTSIALHLLSLALGFPYTPLSAVCCWVVIGLDRVRLG